MSDTLEIFGNEYTNVAGFKATDDNDNILTYIRPQGTVTISQSGTTDVTEYETASVATGTAGTPTTSITANPSISVSNSGLITATASASQSVTPTVSAGYVSSGTAGTVTVSGSNTQQMTTQAAQTVTPTTSTQTVGAAGRYMTGAVTVNPIPSNYIIPSGSETKTENGTYDVTILWNSSRNDCEGYDGIKQIPK